MPPEPEYRPAGHSVTALDPSRQYPPAEHCAHADAFVPVWKRPASHAVHAPWPGWSAYLPVLHAAGAVEPVLQYEPTGQLKQPDSAEMPPEPEYRPAGHSVTADAPSPQYPPAVLHCTQPVAPGLP